MSTKAFLPRLGALLVFAAPLYITGCGSGSGSQRSVARTQKAQIWIAWPAKTASDGSIRYIPTYASSLFLRSTPQAIPQNATT